jgi:hypothetical protein
MAARPIESGARRRDFDEHLVKPVAFGDLLRVLDKPEVAGNRSD